MSFVAFVKFVMLFPLPARREAHLWYDNPTCLHEVGAVVNAFSLMVAVGAGLGLVHVLRGTPEVTSRRWIFAGALMLLAGFVGARLGYTLIHEAYFDAHPAEIFQVWLGGLFWPGALPACLLGAYLLAFCWRVPVGLVVDRLAGMAFPLAAAAWIGCWLVGAAYGSPVSENAWYGLMIQDESGAIMSRFPVQPLAAVVLVLSYSLLPRPRPGRPVEPGVSGLGALMVLGLNLLVFSALVDVPGPRWNGQRIETWAALALAAAAALILFFTRRIAARKHNILLDVGRES